MRSDLSGVFWTLKKNAPVRIDPVRRIIEIVVLSSPIVAIPVSIIIAAVISIPPDILDVPANITAILLDVTAQVVDAALCAARSLTIVMPALPIALILKIPQPVFVTPNVLKITANMVPFAI